MPVVNESEVLLLWRALRRFRSREDSRLRTTRPAPAQQLPALCRLSTVGNEPDDYRLSLEETLEQTERRRARWAWVGSSNCSGPRRRGSVSRA